MPRPGGQANLPEGSLAQLLTKLVVLEESQPVRDLAGPTTTTTTTTTPTPTTAKKQQQQQQQQQQQRNESWNKLR